MTDQHGTCDVCGGEIEAGEDGPLHECDSHFGCPGRDGT